MKLKQKLSIIIIVSFLIFLSMVGTIIRFPLLNTYNKIETSFIESNLKLIQNDIKDSADSLNRQLLDWTAWDDTYFYALGEYPEYIEENMMDATFTNLNLSFIWIGDPSGNQLYLKYFDLTTNREISFNNSFMTIFEKNSFLIEEAIKEKTIKGTIKIDGKVFIVAFHAITNSSKELEPSGIMAMGEIINEQWVSNHSDLLNLPFNIYTNLSSVVQKTIMNEIEGIPYLINYNSQNTYLAYTTIKDIIGEEIFLVEQNGQRTIYDAGRNSLFWFMGSLVTLMIILVLSLRFIAGRFIINRLDNIEINIGQFKSDKNTHKSFEIENNDEISNLMIELNDMFKRISFSDKHLFEAKEIAEKTNSAKSEFLRNMSHELRTPLNHIIGFSQLIQDGIPGPVNDTQKEYLTDILGSSSHLLSLINDLLDLSRIESGKMTIKTEYIDLQEIFTQIIDMFKEKTDKKHLSMLYSLATLPNSLKADKRMFIQILYNLLSNAIKFTNTNGTIDISAEISQNNKEIIISIKDTGIGLEVESRDIIFESFGQVEDNLTRQFEGTGLGLALTKNLVELHGGKIWVESKGLGKGSTFSFSLPLT